MPKENSPDPRSDPIVAIIGRSNVGKSALFNRLIRKRKAIVSDEPGVTRDINYERVAHAGVSFFLADSAGLTGSRQVDGNENAYGKTQEFNRRLIKEAALVLFTCDTDGPTAEDRLVAGIVRKSSKPCILVVNKIDREGRSDDLYDFYELGFGEPVAVSAVHGTNIRALEMKIEEGLGGRVSSEEDVAVSTPDAEARGSRGLPAEAMPASRSVVDVAIVGKPNVGKSSLLNQLVGKERALVTPIPGTTRDSIDEVITRGGRSIRLIDTAGLRKRGKVRESVEYYSLLRTEQAVQSSSLSILLLDATEKVSIQDKKIAAIVVKEKKGLIIAANKWDLAEEMGITEKSFREDLLFFFPHIAFAEVVPISAKTGYNKTKLLEKILDVYHNYTKRVKTSELNQLIRRFTLRGAAVKYGYQKSTAPPVFEFFIGGSDVKNRNFQRFILNSLRKSVDLRGVPVDIFLRKK